MFHICMLDLSVSEIGLLTLSLFTTNCRSQSTTLATASFDGNVAIYKSCTLALCFAVLHYLTVYKILALKIVDSENVDHGQTAKHS